jgi:hypothetical protein
MSQPFSAAVAAAAVAAGVVEAALVEAFGLNQLRRRFLWFQDAPRNC